MRISYLLFSYFKHILTKFGGGFTKFVLYSVLAIPTISAVAQLFFSYLKANVSHKVDIDYGAVATSASFPLYFMIAIAASFLISTITSSDYPTFMRYRKMDKGMWLALYGVTLSLLFLPMFVAFFILFLGGISLFPQFVPAWTTFTMFINESFKWFLASLIATNIIVTFSILMKKPSFSSIASAIYPMVLGIILSIITEIANISYTATSYINVASVIFSLENTPMSDLLLNSVLYTGIMFLAFIYRGKTLWR
jgi:hypothetical protein